MTLPPATPLKLPFQKVLIANRGEIAVRIIQACQELGLATVAVYSEADRAALHVQLADEAHEIGPAPVSQSYLNVDAILQAVAHTGAGAIHPGYGFLAENAAFARACREAGIVFIGPSPEVMEAVGGKIAARALAERVGVPVVPGETAAITNVEHARAVAGRIGYPVAIKASAGGGGRGLKVVSEAGALADALDSAQREGTAYFADATVFIERYLSAPRHIEVQIAGDALGHVIAVGTRDCSVQRNHQKLIEEAPAPLAHDLTQRIMDAATRIARAIEYTGAGTAEFLVEGNTFYFLEMNTRIQVEHTVTEEVTGLDLVKMQVLVAAGAPLPFTEHDCVPRGHAIECRVNAEDPAVRFRAGSGALLRYRPPTGPGIRVDSGVYQDYTIPAQYDSMIAKVIARGQNREEARQRMLRALHQFDIAGVPSTVPFHLLALADPAFMSGEVPTTFIESLDLSPLTPQDTPAPTLVEAAEPAEIESGERFLVEVNDKRFTVRIAPDKPRRRARSQARTPGRTGNATGEAVRSPMHGVILRVAVEQGQHVNSGDLLMVVEAMKMENEITAQRDGTIVSVEPAVGDTVEVGTPLVTIA